MTKTINYPSDQDVELWVAKSDGWALPIHVRHCVVSGDPMVHATPGVPYGYAQSESLDVEVVKRGGEKVGSGWLMSPGVMSQFCEKAAGITPEFYFHWGITPKQVQKRAATYTPRKGVRQFDDDEFIEHVAAKSGLDRAHLIMAWMAITQFSVSWLLSGKRISMGAFTLLALPYRSNWKELVMARYPTFRNALRLANPSKFLSMAFTEASRIIRMSELTECRTRNKRLVFGWTIEILHDPSWGKECDDIECSAVTAMGREGYIRRWANRVAHLEETIYEVLSARLAKENSETCRVLHRRGEHHSRFAQAPPTRISTPQIVECSDGCDSSVDDAFGIADSTQYLEEKAERLLKMPPQKPAVDLRPPGGDVEPDGNDRVLVPPSNGSSGPSEGMLEGRSQWYGLVDPK